MTSPVVAMPNPQGGGLSAIATSTPPSRLPSILGMYAFAAATFVVAANMAHWYGGAQSAIVLFPLVLFFGLAEFYAAAWAFRTNDAIAVAMHGTWGAFWTAYGILELLYSNGKVAHTQATFSELGFWFIVIAAITWGITAASRNNEVRTVLGLLAIGATLEAIAELTGVEGLRMLAGYFLIASSLVAWYVASAVMVRFTRQIKSPTVTSVAPGETARVA